MMPTPASTPAAGKSRLNLAPTLLPPWRIASHSNKEVRTMKRILAITAPFIAAAALTFAGPVTAHATANKVTCKQIRAELASGKSPADVAKELKISKKTVDHCNAKVASTKKHSSSSGSTTH
jgi:hypothetical protein